MRLRPLAAALAFVVAGCRGSVTDPFRATTAPAPSGLPVSFAFAGDSLPATRSISAAGDSVVVTDQLTAGFICEVQNASAGVENGTLVVTVIRRWQDEPCYILLRADVLSPGPFFRAIVHSAPRGRYDVVVRERIQKQKGSTSFDERQITRQAVTLR